MNDVWQFQVIIQFGEQHELLDAVGADFYIRVPFLQTSEYCTKGSAFYVHQLDKGS